MVLRWGTAHNQGGEPQGLCENLRAGEGRDCGRMRLLCVEEWLCPGLDLRQWLRLRLRLFFSLFPYGVATLSLFPYGVAALSLWVEKHKGEKSRNDLEAGSSVPQGGWFLTLVP